MQVRMNMLNNWLPGEKLDVWVARHAGRQPASFYGFEQEEASVSPDEVNQPFAVGPLRSPVHGRNSSWWISLRIFSDVLGDIYFVNINSFEQEDAPMTSNGINQPFVVRTRGTITV